MAIINSDANSVRFTQVCLMRLALCGTHWTCRHKSFPLLGRLTLLCPFIFCDTLPFTFYVEKEQFQQISANLKWRISCLPVWVYVCVSPCVRECVSAVMNGHSGSEYRPWQSRTDEMIQKPKHCPGSHHFSRRPRANIIGGSRWWSEALCACRKPTWKDYKGLDHEGDFSFFWKDNGHLLGAFVQELLTLSTIIFNSPLII